MSFFDTSDTEDEEKPAIQLFSHASRQAPPIATSVHRIQRSERLSPKKESSKPKKNAKRKSKDLESEDELESSRGSQQATTRITRSRRDEGLSVDHDLGGMPSIGHASPVKVVKAPEIADSPAKLVEVSETEDTDDEFAEIARQARLEQRNRLGKIKDDNTTADSAQLDPKVEIFITSPIPGTQALRVFLRLSQRLGMVREAWCKRQNFAEGDESNVYLTYCKRRIYDASTPRSLGLAIDVHGRLYFQGRPEEQDAGKVHLEAVNDVVLEAEQQRAHEVESKMAAPDDTPQNDQEEQVIRIVLRANKMKDFRLRVKPTTSIAKISFAYRRKRGIPDEKQVVIAFDGEDLADELLIGNTDISDLDVVEVHIR